jgi:hypothetical protein
MGGTDVHVDFDASASLRKWPSIGAQKKTDTKHPSPYLLMEDTLRACLHGLLAKPPSRRHLYEIHTSAQEPLIPAIISAEHAAELVRLQCVQETLFK